MEMSLASAIVVSWVYGDIYGDELKTPESVFPIPQKLHCTYEEH